MQIKRFLIRFFCGAALFLFCLYLAVIAAFPKYINSVQFKDLIEMEINKQTGLHVGIENIIIKPALSPYINIHANHIGLLYPDKKELLKIKDMTIKIKVLPILKKKIYLDKIIIERPIIAFTIDKDGNCTLDKYLKMNFIPQEKIAGFSFENHVPNIEINRYKIKAYDKMYKEPFLIEGKRLIAEQLVLKNGIKFQTKGKISHNGKQYIDYICDIESPVFKVTDRIFAQNPFRYIEKYQINSNIISKLKIKENGKKPQLFGTTEINNLSFKIDNMILNKNHINCKFENDKIIINADLQTDKTNHLTAFGHYSYGKNKNIDLTVKAENANINTLKNTLETILNALNIKNIFSEYDAKGKINLNFKIKSDFKNLKSEGFAEIINADVSSKHFKYSVSGINSKINFENNSIKIENSKLFINNTPVIISGTIDSKTNLNILVKSQNLDAEKISKIFLPNEIKHQTGLKGNLNFSAEIKGTAKSPKTIINAELNNITITNKKKDLLKFEKGKLNYTESINKPKGELILNNTNILPLDLSNALKANNLTIYITSDGIEIPENTFLYGETPFVATGKIIEYTSKEPKYEFSVIGKIASKPLYSYLKKSGILKNIQMAAKGNLSVKGKIIGKGNNFSVKADVKADKNNYLSSLVIKELLNQPSVTIIDAGISNNNLTIKELSLNKANDDNTLNKIAALNGKIKDLNNPILENIKFNVPKSMTFSIAQLQNSEVTIKSNLLINGKLKTPEIKGNLDVSNLTIPEYNVKSKTNEIILEDKNIKITIPKLEIGKSKFNITANILPTLQDKYTIKNLTLNSEYMDLDEINESFSKMQSSPVYPGVSLPINAPYGKASIKIFRTGDLQAENVNCDISIANDILKMSNITGTAYKGSISGKSEYNFLHTSTLSEINGKKADLRLLIKALTGKDDETTGLVDYKVKINSIGTKRIQQQKTAKGYVEFTATRGMMGPLGQFEHFLYAQNLISQSIMKLTTMMVIKAVRPQNTGLYTIATGNIEINMGNAYLKPLTVEGPNMSLYMTGKINILNDLADLKIYGRISQQVEKVLGDLSNPVPQTIMSSSSETSIGNLFYEEYNTTIPKAITDAIPMLNPQNGLSSRLFTVDIQGAPDSVKAVKSFKWIVGTTKAPVINKVQQAAPQEESKEINKNNSSPQKQENHKNITTQETKTEQKNLPDFMENLPDNFN